MLYSTYCAWFIALLTSPDAVVLHMPWFLAEFDSFFTSAFSLSCIDLCKVRTDDSDHVIS